MTNASDTLRNPQAGSDMAPLRAKWGWIVALGVVYLLAGFVALGSVVTATVVSVLVVGVMMIIAGVAEVFHVGVGADVGFGEDDHMGRSDCGSTTGSRRRHHRTNKKGRSRSKGPATS